MKNILHFLFFTFCLMCSRSTHAQIITTIAGNDTAGFSGDGGPASAAKLGGPGGVALDGEGNLYIAEQNNHRVRKISPSGTITTIAGNGIAGYNGDNIPAPGAKLDWPEGVAVDASGNVFIADAMDNRIRKVDADGIITTLAGDGHGAYNGDNGPATLAELHSPLGVAVDGIGNVYIADGGNNRIRMIDTAGIITTIAGNGLGGFDGDGGAATDARLNGPTSITLDNAGNIYFTDFSHVRKITPAIGGIITTIAGTDTFGYNGDNIQATTAELHRPFGIALDNIGNIYIGDELNHRIRRVNTTGIITTIAGNGTLGFSGDGADATLARLNAPAGVVADASGGIYIADFANNRIRFVRSAVFVNTANNPAIINIYPNPSHGRFIVTASNSITEQMQIAILNAKGEKVKDITASTNDLVEVALEVPAGVYFLNITTEGGTCSKTFSISR